MRHELSPSPTRLLAVIIALAFALGACGAAKKKDDDVVQKEKDTRSDEGDRVDLDDVETDEPGDSPCGNPNWSQLPPGAESAEDEDDEDVSGKGTDSDESEAP